MAKQIARLLKADIQETSDLKSIAKMLSKKGRGGDTMLAHITPKEARILKEAGGAGTVNPDTGLMEFYDEYGYTPDWSETQQNILSTIAPQQPYMDTSGFEGVGEELLGDAAIKQYEGSAFPYTPGGNYQYVGQDVGDQFIKEFPYGMSPLYDLSVAQNAAAGVPAAEAPVVPAGMSFAAEQIPAARQAAIEAGIYAPPTQPGLAQRAGDILSAIKAGGGDVVEYLKKNPELLRLAGAGAGAVTSAQRIKQAEKQIQQATQEQKQVGQPYQKAGQELQRAAMAGELTPQSAQAYQALQAQMRQGIEARGGVGVAQAQAQMEAFRQSLLQNQYNYGLQVAQIGDQIALGAIKTGLQLDQNLQQLAQQYTTNLLAIAGGIAPQKAQQ